MPMTRRALLTAAAASTVTGTLAALSPTTAFAALSDASRTWVDPFAAAAPTADGKIIKKLSAAGGLLYPGYGDWAANIGPIPLHTLNPATGQFSGQLFSLPGETSERQRVFNGSLYVLNVDPKTYWEGGQLFATNASGGWGMSGWTNAVHSLDMTILADGTIIVGGAYIDGRYGYLGRMVWFSYDGGATFKGVGLWVTSNTMQRVYHVLNSAGGVLLGVEDGTVVKWTGLRPVADQTTWDSSYFTPISAPKSVPWDTPSASNGQVAVFGSRFAHDGTAGWRTPLGFTALTTDSGWVYAATSSELWRTKDGHAWQYAATGTTRDVTALAILGTNAYLGTAASTIVEVPLGRLTWRKTAM